jgi:hypothetical protein
VTDEPAEKPVKRIRTRKSAEAPAASTTQPAAEVVTDEPAEKPVKRTRTRKTAEAAAETAEKPVKRTRTRKAAESKAVNDSAAPEAGTAPTMPTFTAPE